MARTIKVYKSYSFRDKDPIIRPSKDGYSRHGSFLQAGR